MHDPMTVAFEIPRPWPRLRLLPGGRLNWPTLITIWHHDPEIGGDEDSCDWFGSNLSRENGWFEHEVENLRTLSPEVQEAVRFFWYIFRHRLSSRPWWRHPRWHLRHWEVQVHPIQVLKRFLFSRCYICGKRFTWDQADGRVVSASWDGPGPQWFKNVEQVAHFSCDSRKLRAVGTEGQNENS